VSREAKGRGRLPVVESDHLERYRPGADACRGAVFTTYTFDARFFEEEVLATLFALSSDPQAALPAFLEEGRRALRDAPVAVLMDRGNFRGGKRLTYDLRFHPSGRTFHPKVALTLHRDHAWLHVGSGNLTEGGYGGNAELAVSQRLAYAADAGRILAVCEFLRGCGLGGEAWERFTRELEALLPAEARPERGGPFLHTEAGKPLLEYFLDRLPAAGKVERVGVLAPFHQEDGAQPDAALLERLQAFAKGRAARGMGFDLGVSWEDSPLAARAGVAVSWQDGHGRLWARLDGREGEGTLSYVVPLRREPWKWIVRDAAGEHAWSLPEVKSLLDEDRLWPVGPVEAFGPARIVKRLSKKTKLQLWLHPGVHQREGQRFAQPLHGKLVAVALRVGRKRETHLLVGSPNASAQALLIPGGNIEAALHVVLPGTLHLPDLCPRLVPCPLDQVSLRPRAYEVGPAPPGRFVRDAVYDAASRVLRVEFEDAAPALRVVYPAPGKAVSVLDGVPQRTVEVRDVELHPACCEIEVTDKASGISSRVPLRVVQVIELPVGGLAAPLNFEELVLLHAGRYSVQGLQERRDRRGDGDGAGEGGAGALLGEGATPRDVFRAFLAMAETLADPDASLSAFQADLEGPWGVRAFGQKLLEAAGDGIIATEAWLYGQELLRALGSVANEGDPAREDKQRSLAAVVAGLATGLSKLAPHGPWADALHRFYGDRP
jgi:hypothetical protein